MTFDETVERLLAGETVTDIGQLSPETCAFLRLAARKNYLFEDHNYTFPITKWSWECNGFESFRLFAKKHASLTPPLPSP